MTTWRDVDRIRNEHPDWTSVEIAAALGCESAYVRATAQRRGWELATGKGHNRKLKVRISELRRVAIPGETPEQTLARLLNKEAA